MIMGFWFFGEKKEDKLKKIEGNLKHSFSKIRRDFDVVNKILGKFSGKHGSHESRLSKIEQELYLLRKLVSKLDDTDDERSIVHERSIAFNRSSQPFMNVQSLKSNITPAQKKVIHILGLAEVPLEYEDLAKELNLNVVTVRRHLNDLRRMGFDVKEKVNLENGRKVFFIEKAVKRVIMRKK